MSLSGKIKILFFLVFGKTLEIVFAFGLRFSRIVAFPESPYLGFNQPMGLVQKLKFHLC